jgi:signal transduction histidine kinase
VLVLTGAFFYDRYSTWIDRQFVQIERQREALSQLENLEAGLSDAATAARGFVLSAESVHVNDYRLAAAATRERLAAMERQERTSGSPGDLLLRQAWSYLDSLDEMVNSVERRGGRPPTRETVSSVGVVSKAAVDSLITLRRTEFADALVARRDVLKGRLQRGRFLNWIAAGAAATFLIGFWTLLRRAFKQRQRAAAALATLNASLEETVRRRTEELTDLSQHLLSVRDEERAALAREIHDEIGSEIMVVRMECDRLQKMRTVDDPAAEASWSRIKHALGELTVAHRRIINALHPTVLDHLGLEAAIGALLKESLEPAGLQYELFVDGCVDDLQPAVGIAAYRVVQEAISNVLKHAHAKYATVELVRDSTALTVQVTDDGVGCASRSMEKGRLGVVGMRERAHQLGGSFNIEPGPNAIGTRVTARFAILDRKRPAK